MTKSINLSIAKSVKNDEFYTRLEDIEKELNHYTKHFKNKIVFCNCDNPEWSNFWKYFKINFNRLGLKKLISTHYSNDSSSYKLELNKDNNDNLKTTKIILKENGDFRSKESVNTLKEADIIVSNPPFSLFREYVNLLLKNNKKFLIVGSQNAITYKEFFPSFLKDEVWLGNTAPKQFSEPDGTIKTFGNICWFTNLSHKKRTEKIILSEKYEGNEFLYPKYDNYDAIEISKLKNIPFDYDGVMGVPITFLDKYNPEQFKIVGITSGREEFGFAPSKKYKNAKQHNKDGTIVNGSKINTRATLKLKETENKTHYSSDSVNYFLKIVYARILIKKI